VKHELASSAYNKRRESCERVVATIQRDYPQVHFLRDVDLAMLNEVATIISKEDFKRAKYVIEEIQRVLEVCKALEEGDYETVGVKMYETHKGMSELYEVSCEELDFLNNCAKLHKVTGSRVMGGGFGGCTLNFVKEEYHDTFIEETSKAYLDKFKKNLKVYEVNISEGARKLC